jgi:hypothetical protein
MTMTVTMMSKAMMMKATVRDVVAFALLLPFLGPHLYR